MTGTQPMTNPTLRAPMLIAAVLSLFLSAFAAIPAQSQELSPEHLGLARKYIDLTDHSGVYEAAIVQAGIDSYRQLLPQNPEIAPQLNGAIETVLTSYRGKKGDLFNQIARVYALTFSEEELNEIVTFYESPTGQKLSKANAQLNQTIQRVMAVFQINLNTEFFAAVRAELKAKGIDS